MTKHIFAGIFLLLSLILTTPSVEAKYASIVIDVETNQVIHEENADTMNYPASLTKMMTLYMLFEKLQNNELEMETTLKVSRRASRVSPTKLGLKAGQTITVKNAISALIIKSANDVAVVVAEALGKTERNFAKMMTKRARELGMGNTYFRNASGLPDKGQLSSARDMALLGIALLRDFPQFYHFFSKRKFKYHRRIYKTHNSLLLSYKGTDGIKTGYTRDSGYNLVTSVIREGKRIIVVVFGGKTKRWRDRHVRYLLNKGFKTVLAGQ